MLRRFQPGLVPTLAALVAVTVLSGLGFWQLQRLHWKRGLIAEWTARSELPPLPVEQVLASPTQHEYRRATARGTYDRDHSVLLLHVRRELRLGAEVLTPLLAPALEPEADAILVDRGWIPADRVDSFLDRMDTPGPAQVTGLVRVVDFGAPPVAPPSARRITWNRLQPKALQAQIPYRLAPILLVREEQDTSSLPLGGFEPPRSRVDHRSYAIIWFSMAALAFFTWVGVGVKQGREAAGRRSPSHGARPRS